MKILTFSFCFLLASSAAVLGYQDGKPSPTSTTVSDDFIIGLQDVLSINVWKEPELSVKEVMVRPDGKISLPLVGDLQASGFTPRQLQDKISERMKEFVAAPNITVVVLKIGSQSVSIVGQVAKPGVYYLGAPMTVLELLARAGGFREEAKTKKIAIVRQDGNKTNHFSFNYNEVSNGRNLQQNISLKNGDVIIVP